MTGPELKRAIKADGIRIADLSSKTGIKERTILSLYLKEVVEDHYVRKIEGAGIKLHLGTDKPGNALKEALEQIMEAYNSKFARLEKDHENTKKELYKLRGEFDLIKGMVIKQPVMAKK